jgi:4-hydroxybenzoate polyprenyltransferase
MSSLTPADLTPVGRRARTVPRVIRAAYGEVQLSWRFINHDCWTTIIPASLFVLAAAVHSSAAPTVLVIRAILGLLYFYLFIYGFTLTNQLAGMAEDRINKPFRPLVAGHCTRQSALRRAAVVLVAFPLLGWALGVAGWAVLWEAVFLLHNCAGLARNWLAKDLIMGVGVFSQLAAAWQMITPLTAPVLHWVITLAVAITLLIPLQDLRDVRGDLAVGRRTFPVWAGERAARAYLAVGFTMLPVAVHVLLLGPSRARWVAWPVDGLLAVLNLTVAVRVLLLRTPEKDHKTYRIFELWYSILLASAVVVLNVGAG